MTRIVGGLDIDRTFTAEEIFELHARGQLRSIALEGYCTRADADGTIRFIPWHQSTKFRSEMGKLQTHVSHDFTEAMRQDVEAEHPMVRRTPQERVAAMVLRLLSEAKSHGTIPGLSDEQIREIVGEHWKSGITDVTEEMVRKVAAHFLQKAEHHNREADSERITRQHQFS